MTTLLILRGVPGSGKSTEAIALVSKGYVRVNRDDIRFSLFGKYWGVDEDVVTAVENAAIQSALAAKSNVVLDATNLNRKALKTKLSLASRYGADVAFMDFVVSLDTAIARDAGRERKVGASVIRGFFKRYKVNPETGMLPAPPEPLPVFEKYVPTGTLDAVAYIVDTDGTVANHDGVRNPYDTSRYHLDTVHEHVANVVSALSYRGYKVVALSGRDESFREVTEKWWEDNGLHFDAFFMRPAGDKRMDAIVKYELFTKYIAPNYHVLGAFDDRPQVFRMWETIGLPVFAVGTREEF